MMDGELYVSGRLKDILIVNGRNYYPQTIEWAVEEVIGVRRGSAVVFSRPGKASEEVVVAVETRERDADKLRSAIIAKVSEDVQLAVADVALLPPGSIPKTSSGKLQRRKTRDLYLSGALGREGARVAGPMGNRFLAAKHLAYSLVGRARHEARGLVRKLTGA
jgi:fatty-acyl-CoA synthase